MNRRAFISGGAAISGLRAGELRMPSDSADGLGFWLMRYSLVSSDRPVFLQPCEFGPEPMKAQSPWCGPRFGHLMKLAKPKKGRAYLTTRKPRAVRERDAMFVSRQGPRRAGCASFYCT
jgi:hypothetical protein